MELRLTEPSHRYVAIVVSPFDKSKQETFVFDGNVTVGDLFEKIAERSPFWPEAISIHNDKMQPTTAELYQMEKSAESA